MKLLHIIALMILTLTNTAMASNKIENEYEAKLLKALGDSPNCESIESYLAKRKTQYKRFTEQTEGFEFIIATNEFNNDIAFVYVWNELEKESFFSLSRKSYSITAAMNSSCELKSLNVKVLNAGL